MNKLSIFVILFVCVYSRAVAQLPLNAKQYGDSLQAVLSSNKTDSAKTRTIFRLAEYWMSKDSIQARQYLEQGQQLAGKDPYLTALSFYYAGVLKGKAQPDEGIRFYIQADSLLAGFPSSKEALLFRSKAWHNHATLMKIKDDTKSYTDFILNKAIPFAQLAGDSAYVGKNYVDLAIGFKNLNDFARAESYLLTALAKLRGTRTNPEYLATAYHTIAENYVLSGQNPKAKVMLDSLHVLLEAYPESAYWLDYYAGRAMYLTIEGQFAQSVAIADTGISMAKRMKETYPEQRLLLQKFYALYNQKSFSAAKDVLLELMGKREFMGITTNRIQLFYGLAESYAGMNNMGMAYQWLKKYSQLSDSLYSSRLQTDMNALEAKYNNSENQKKIAALEAEKKQATLSARNQRLTNWLLGIATICLLIGISFLVYYYRNNKKLSEQKEINYRQQLKQMEQQQQLDKTNSMLEGEERERRRVARDLHDGLGGMLAGIRIKLSGATQGEGRGPSMESIIDQLDNSVHELRRIARNMMPESLLKFGLETALKDLAESMMTEYRHIDFQAFGIEKTLPLPEQVTIYRIVQEALSNAVRHADASKIVIQCSQNGNVFFVTVEDNGKGFDTTRVKEKEGIGLGNIRSRVEYLKGKMDISSAIDEGTTINIELNVTG